MASAAENEARLFSATSLNRNVSFFSNTSAWTFYILAVAVLRWAAYAFLPHDIFDTAAQWTIVHLVHGLLTFVALHLNTDSPDWNDQGEHIHETVWEQIDNSMMWTGARKVLLIVPIVLFVLTMNFVGYDSSLQSLANIVMVVLAIVPKMPEMHGVRLCTLRRHYE